MGISDLLVELTGQSLGGRPGLVTGICSGGSLWDGALPLWGLHQLWVVSELSWIVGHPIRVCREWENWLV